MAPAYGQETEVAEIFAALLDVERVGATDDFFAIGGTSLSAMRLAARVGEVTGSEISVRDLFDAPHEATSASQDLSPGASFSQLGAEQLDERRSRSGDKRITRGQGHNPPVRESG